MFAKDGLGMIAGSIAIFLVSLGAAMVFPHPALYALATALGIFSVFNLFFFRDPERKIPQNPLAVLSPADGKITQIVSVQEPDFFAKEVQRISIFLSVFNVHVNRLPITGKVEYFMYRTGKFLAAFKTEASLENEQTVIGMIDRYGHKVLFKQIAGIIARRIICHVREGQTGSAGDRMGLIRFGSRVDVFIPLDASIQVKTGDTVKGGETVLATFPEEGSYARVDETLLERPQTEPAL